MPKVFQLAHVALGVPDPAQAREYYVDTLGLSPVASDSGAEYLSVGFAHHDLVLEKGDGRRLAHVGYLLSPGTGLDDLAKTLGGAGFKAQIKSDAQPGVAKLAEVEVVPGHTVQVYEAGDAPAPGFSGKGIGPLNMGHVAIVSPEAPKLVQFYRDVMGFHETDWIGDLATFMTCNSDHHVINVVNAPVNMVHHLAFQLSESAEHARAADTLRRAGIKTCWGPSRHTAGHNLAAYHKDPADLLIELYTDMDVFVPELNMCQPRPWHEHLPMRPRKWGLDELSNWGVDFQYDLARG
ncbi:MAG: VOC family protein [Pseudooceanicola sp.]|nr:VOC family protein [Pseudooceanicola sp.]